MSDRLSRFEQLRKGLVSRRDPKQPDDDAPERAKVDERELKVRESEPAKVDERELKVRESESAKVDERELKVRESESVKVDERELKVRESEPVKVEPHRAEPDPVRPDRAEPPAEDDAALDPDDLDAETIDEPDSAPEPAPEATPAPEPTPTPEPAATTPEPGSAEWSIERLRAGVSDEFDADAWMETEDGWLHVESATMFDSPTGVPIEWEPRPISVTSSIAEQGLGLGADGAIGPPVSEGGPTELQYFVGGMLGDPGDAAHGEGSYQVATMYDPVTKAYLSDSGAVVGFHESVADDVTPPIRLPDGGPTVFIDQANHRMIDATTGQPVDLGYDPITYAGVGADGPGRGVEAYMNTRLSLDGLEADEVMVLLADAGVEGVDPGGPLGFHASDPTLAALLESDVEGLTLDLATGELLFDADAPRSGAFLETAYVPEHSDHRRLDDRDIERQRAGVSDEFDADEWMPTEQGWLHVESGAMFDSPAGIPIDWDPGPIDVTSAIAEQGRGLTPSGAEQPPVSDQVSTDAAPGFSLFGTLAPAGAVPGDVAPQVAVSYDPATKAFLSESGQVVGFHQSIADDVTSSIRLPDGGPTVFIDPANQRMIDAETGQPVDLGYDPALASGRHRDELGREDGEGHLNTRLSLDEVDPEEMYILLADAGVEGLEPGGPFGYQATDPTLKALLESDVQGLSVDLATGQLIADPDAPGPQEFFDTPHQPGVRDLLGSEWEQERERAGVADEFDMDRWMVTEHGWLHVETATMFDSPTGVPIEWEPQVLELSSSMAEQGVGLGPGGANRPAQADGGMESPQYFVGGLLGSPSETALGEGSYQMATMYDPVTRTYLSDSGDVVAFHESIAEQMTAPIRLPGGGPAVIVDPVNHRLIDAETGRPVDLGYDTEEFFRGPDGAEGYMNTRMSLDDMSPDELMVMLADAGVEGVEPGGPFGFHASDPTLAALLESDVQGLTLDLATGELVVDPNAPGPGQFLDTPYHPDADGRLADTEALPPDAVTEPAEAPVAEASTADAPEGSDDPDDPDVLDAEAMADPDAGDAGDADVGAGDPEALDSDPDALDSDPDVGADDSELELELEPALEPEPELDGDPTDPLSGEPPAPAGAEDAAGTEPDDFGSGAAAPAAEPGSSVDEPVPDAPGADEPAPADEPSVEASFSEPEPDPVAGAALPEAEPEQAAPEPVADELAPEPDPIDDV